MFSGRPLDGPFKCCIFIKNNNLSALTDSTHNKPSSLHCSPRCCFSSNAKSRVIGCGRPCMCIGLTHAGHNGRNEASSLFFFSLLSCCLLVPKQVRGETLDVFFMFTDSLPSPLIRADPRALRHTSSLFDRSQLHIATIVGREEITSANAICVNNCMLSCPIRLLGFDVSDVIKSVLQPQLRPG